MSARKKSNGDPPGEQARADTLEVSLEQVREALRGLRYGHVTIIVQDSVPVQIERTEKKRLV